MLATTLRQIELSDFEEVNRFFRFNSAFSESFVVKHDCMHYDSFKRLCQIVGHWQLTGYGWLGMFDNQTNGLLGIAGAEFNQYLGNAELTLIASDVPGKN